MNPRRLVKSMVISGLSRRLLSMNKRLGFINYHRSPYRDLSTLKRPRSDPLNGYASQSDESESSDIPIEASSATINPLISAPIRREHQLYSDILENIFQKNSIQRPIKINPYWYESLKRLNRHKARVLVSQLNPACPLGFDPLATPSANLTSYDDSMETFTVTAMTKKGSLLSYVREQKERYSECILLTRVGEFYEAYGIDAILLVEHCGLNPM